MMAVIKSLQTIEATTSKPISRKLWLYDTFEGMSAPTDTDIDFLGNDAQQLLNQQQPEDPQSVWCLSGLDDVRKNVGSTGYSDQQIEFVAGKVEETLPSRIPEQIALLRLDTDWYESTMHELIHLFPRLVVGGVIIIDDYGHWQGCRRAVDEYFANNNVQLLLNRIDYTARIGVKIS